METYISNGDAMCIECGNTEKGTKMYIKDDVDFCEACKPIDKKEIQEALNKALEAQGVSREWLDSHIEVM